MTSLSGPGWELKGYLGDDWVWRNAEKPDTRDRLGWMPAEVPGSVHWDLYRAGLVPDPYVGRNSLALEWVPARTWIYRRRFVAPSGRRVRLRFEGVDHTSRVFLDGEELGSTRGMFRPASFEVGDRLRAGAEHHLAVVVDPAPPCEPQVGRTERVTIHKSRMGYGWDFCPRMIHLGIWDDVDLLPSGPLAIEDAWVRTVLSDGDRRATLRVAVALSGGDAGELEVSVRDPEGRVVAEARCAIGACWPQVEAVVELSNPRLWWPNGLGAQPLYAVEIAVRAAGELSDRRSVPVGVRRIEVLPGLAFAANGRRFYVNGWNWVPLDVLVGRRLPERLARLTALARDAHVNLLRVWGGGLIERSDFYQRCDALGLMVWQEFSLSSSGISSKTSEDPAYVALLREEARDIVPRRRNHPSLVLWCGGNELKTTGGEPLGDDDPALAALREVVRELDPDRAWLPTSPSGPHEVHGPWEHQGLLAHNAQVDGGTSLFSSEFGVEGMANRDALEALVPAEDRWPAGRENPVYAHLGAWWNNEPLVQQIFGPTSDLEKLRRASQYLQAEGLRYAVEGQRRRWPRHAGSIPWQLNESYPNAWCTSAVCHDGTPKPAYQAVARAYAPVLACAAFASPALGEAATFRAELWVVTAAVAPASARFIARLRARDGAVHAEASVDVAVAPDSSVRVGAVEWPVPAVAVMVLELVLVLANESVLAGNRYHLCRGTDLSALREGVLDD